MVFSELACQLCINQEDNDKMLKGRITIEDDAIVKISLIFRDIHLQKYAVVDTGFNGYISIPGNIIRQSNWIESGKQDHELANGQIVRESLFIGEVIFDRKKRTVLAIQSDGSDILIGTKLLSGRLCEFDYGSNIVRIRKGNVLR